MLPLRAKLFFPFHVAIPILVLYTYQLWWSRCVLQLATALSHYGVIQRPLVAIDFYFSNACWICGNTFFCGSWSCFYCFVATFCYCLHNKCQYFLHMKRTSYTNYCLYQCPGLTTSTSPLVAGNCIIYKLFAKVISDYIGLTCLSCSVPLLLFVSTLHPICHEEV